MVLIISFQIYREIIFFHNKLHVLKVCNWMHFDRGICPWKHPHGPDSERVPHPQRILQVAIRVHLPSSLLPRQPQGSFLSQRTGLRSYRWLSMHLVSVTQRHAFVIPSPRVWDQGCIPFDCWVVLHDRAYTTGSTTILLLGALFFPTFRLLWKKLL